MKQFFLTLACLFLPSVCLGQVAVVDPLSGVTIKRDLSDLQYNATRTIYFDNNDGTSVEANLPPDTGYIYIYNSQTRKGVVEFSRQPQCIYRLNDCYELPCGGYRYSSR